MRYGIDIAQQRLEWDELVRRARFAEEVGFDGLWGFDHFKPMYGDTPGPTFEGMTTLAALAGLTSRIRLGLLVTGVTYRHPSVLAAEAVTIDHASHGRLELALGAAWFEEEHRELGIEFPPVGRRIDMLEDAVEMATLLMSGETVSFEGRVFALRNARLLPRPVQQPRIPLWIGGSGERRMLPLVARHADMWHAFGSLEDMKRKSALIDRLAAEAGRDPAAIGRSTSLSLSGSLDEVRRHAEQWAAAGFSYLVCGWPSEGQERVEEFVSQVLPQVR
ncbi:MAG TPA: TIGR03560 family F420-dependent LLM class oxidoreductase [Candidatus Angelobacter sp.]|jgi:F420-dependent oxidoreductase-like protein|nr:TIGR03560 family F420-dependent LLM class oxidoreductase [Candidatus Angelobacter sp.]